MEAIVEPLLEWYGRNARSLPWREEPAPYRVWVSEIMLQQTRAEAVKPYVARFLTELPDVPALASAPEQQLMKLWEGLGYYSRARNLQKAARVMVEQYGGTLPADYDALLKLPGIGPYTAGAVASIAYGIPVPAVDGNVLRVVMRLTAGWEDIADPAVKRAVERRMAAILPKDRPGDFNQAMMEAPATVCAPGGSRNAWLPLNALCEGYRQGLRGNSRQSQEEARRIGEEDGVPAGLRRRARNPQAGGQRPLGLWGASLRGRKTESGGRCGNPTGDGVHSRCRFGRCRRRNISSPMWNGI
ncbi:MAG: A/G-specific adenine glycosylase [Anaeromassilibacillus sp.]